MSLTRGRRYGERVALLIDPPRWPAHGRLWSHLVSDSSLDELHAFAMAAGIPARAFDLDHYDVPDTSYRMLVEAGAYEVEAKELLRRLVASGLRVPGRERRVRRMP
jgi:hypothetical protein